MVSKNYKTGKMFPIIFVVCAVLLLSAEPVRSTPETTFTEQFRLENASTRYYIASLDLNETWSLNCTGLYEGKYYLYLFQERPVSSHMFDNGSIDPEILNAALTYNVTPSQIFSDALNDTVYTTSVNFTASTATVYYLQIILVEGGPDTFILFSSVEFQAYYIPFIAGYSVNILVGGIFLTGLILFRRITKKIKPSVARH